MAAYYNELDLKAAAWLRELIKQGNIAPGDVDERSIEDVAPDDLRPYSQCHFFAGIGVWSRALRSAGWPDDRPVWTGSCPCQPFSSAGKGAGFADERHLWPAFHHLVSVCRPPVVFGEQVASKDGLGWLDLVQADLEGSGYASGAVDLCAAGVGAPHIRQRLWWVAERTADTDSGRGLVGVADAERNISGRQPGEASGTEATGGCVEEPGHNGLVDDGAASRPGPVNGVWRHADWLCCRDGKWRPVEAGTFPLSHGAPARVGRLRGYGNAIVAPAAQAFIEAYLDTKTLDY
jgi:DNA (cytosine-5)-methyltransferase 1